MKIESEGREALMLVIGLPFLAACTGAALIVSGVLLAKYSGNPQISTGHRNHRNAAKLTIQADPMTIPVAIQTKIHAELAVTAPEKVVLVPLGLDLVVKAPKVQLPLEIVPQVRSAQDVAPLEGGTIEGITHSSPSVIAKPEAQADNLLPPPKDIKKTEK